MEANGTVAGEDAATTALSVAVTVISVVGLLLNVYILVIIIITKQPASASSVLLVHLGAVGALASGVALCGGGSACICGGLLHALHPLQLWTVCGLHADRAAAIAAPLHYAAIVSAKKVLIGVASSWIMLLVLMTPLAIAQPPLAYSIGLGGCAPDCSAGPLALSFCITYALLTFFLPTILVLICSLKILRIARYHRHRIAAAIYEVTLSAQVTVTHQRNPFATPPPPRRKALSAVLQPLGSLAILYLPYYCIMIWPAISVPPQSLAAISTALISAAPPVNGILYGIRSRPLRDSLRNYRRKRMTKSEVTQEIQARTPSACGSRRPSLSAGSGCIRPPTTRRLSDAAAMGMRGSERPAPRASSCNMLQNSQDEEVHRPRVSAIPLIRAPPHVVLGRALGLEENIGIAPNRRRRQSPRITVTRALSDECESPSRRPLCRQQSRSSGALLGIMYSTALPEHVNDSADEQLLLTWPQQAKKQEVL